jgi:hypothetical protein
MWNYEQIIFVKWLLLFNSVSSTVLCPVNKPKDREWQYLGADFIIHFAPLYCFALLMNSK